MDDKAAAKILLEIIKKYNLGGQEKEAVESAVGVLAWTALSQSQIARRKSRIEEKFKQIENEK